MDIRVTGQITTFVGANEDPLSDGGNWAHAGVLSGGAMARKGNAATNSIIFGATLGHSYWTPRTFTDTEILEVWGQAEGGGGGAAGDGWRLGFFTSPGNGYTGLFFSNGTPLVGIRKYTAGSFINIPGGGGFSSVGGAAYFLFRKIGPVLEWWASPDAGANWTLDATCTDFTYSGDFYLVIGAEDQGGGQIDEWRAIGGGNPVTRTQIYRVLNGQIPRGN